MLPNLAPWEHLHFWAVVSVQCALQVISAPIRAQKRPAVGREQISTLLEEPHSVSNVLLDSPVLPLVPHQWHVPQGTMPLREIRFANFARLGTGAQQQRMPPFSAIRS